MSVDILWEGNPITCMKTYGTNHCVLCMEERCAILEQWKVDKNKLINNRSELYGGCRHRTKFHRLRKMETQHWWRNQSRKSLERPPSLSQCRATNTDQRPLTAWLSPHPAKQYLTLPQMLWLPNMGGEWIVASSPKPYLELTFCCLFKNIGKLHSNAELRKLFLKGTLAHDLDGWTMCLLNCLVNISYNSYIIYVYKQWSTTTTCPVVNRHLLE